jgi:nitroimidazol reductase NimA-like FMN-containing flavoprotein (pyridoxamine 5'-phosphate oxidase superfamily)
MIRRTGMRQAKKAISDPEVLHNILRSCRVGRLGTNGKDGYPRVKPLNYVLHEGRIYFHSAREGEKIDDINRDDRVCFEADQPLAFVRGAADNPCRAEYLYRSVIIRGRARIVGDEEERRSALSALMEKYQPGGGYGPFREEKLAITAVVRVDIEELTGKEDLGKGTHRDMALDELRNAASGDRILDP